MRKLLLAIFALTASSGSALAEEAMEAAAEAVPTLNSGDTAWMLTATALVLLMTIPGVALFYGGMVRKPNVLATVMQSFTVTCMITIILSTISYPSYQHIVQKSRREHIKLNMQKIQIALLQAQLFQLPQPNISSYSSKYYKISLHKQSNDTKIIKI